MSTRKAFAIVVLLLSFAPFVRAQQAAATASVSGTVYDPGGGVVPGASVSLRNRETSQVLEATSDRRGQFRVLYAPVGNYHMSVTVPGFVTTTLDLTLSLGQALDVPVTLGAAAAAETVSVSGQAPLVEAARIQIADTITPREVDTLPLNGRNYLDLALLAPNVSRTNTRSNERFAETSAVPGTGITVAGQRNIGNNFIVDGLSANDDAADLAGTYYGEEVIREFQVITSGGGAEFGRASAGIINIVTQSGANTRRGRGYAFYRDDAFDARNALATADDPLMQVQYGATLSGPIVADRTFWFANVERTQNERTGFVTIADGNVAAVNGTLSTFGYAGPRVVNGPFETGYDTTNLFGRVDHLSSLRMRYGLYSVNSPNARSVGGLNDVSRGTRLDDTDHTAAVSYVSSLSPRAFNEARAQYTRSRLAAPANDPVGPAISISGVANLGTSASSPTGRDLDTFQIADTVTLQRGSHLIKVGADALYNRVTVLFPGATSGTYTFQSLATLQRGVYVQFQQAFGVPSMTQSNPNLGLFVQDEWRPGRGVTVTTGLRYDLQWLPDPIALDANNISPRAGVAWAPGDGRTVVRASGGVYFDRIPLRARSNALQRDGLNYRVAVLSFGQPGAPAFPSTLPAFPSGALTAITSIDPDIQNGRSVQASVQLERAFGSSAAATVGYSYLRGRQIIMSRNVNVPTLTAADAAALGVPNLGRPNPAFGNISQYQSIGDSWFKGLTVSLGTRNIPWGSVRLSYTLSKAEDTAGNAFFQTPQDAHDVAAERGPADNDQRHRLVVSGTLGGESVRGRASRVFGGIQVGYLFGYSTGAPFTAVTGNDRNNDTNVNDRPIGFGRNSERLSRSSSLDLRVSRTFAIGDQRLDAMIEGFNVFNQVNILNVNNSYGTGSTPSLTFGQPTLANDPRQFQLGVRWSF
jgi:hypothetical protein